MPAKGIGDEGEIGEGPSPALEGHRRQPFVFDYVARQKIDGTHMSTFIVDQLPVPPARASASSIAWAPIVRKNDEKVHLEYRTKRVILEICDGMAEAVRTGQPYPTRLDPPPVAPRVAHLPGPARERTRKGTL